MMSTRMSIIHPDGTVNRPNHRIISVDERSADPGYHSAVTKATAETTPGTSRRRRAPEPGERRRDPERTREKILDAATTEVSDKGYPGPPLGRIAAPAGGDQQPITYYLRSTG